LRKTKKDTFRSVYQEREYGGYWYSGIWKILRPVLVGFTVGIVVIGIIMNLWNRFYDGYVGPVNPADSTEIIFSIESGQSLTRVANNLEASGLIHNKSVFKYYCDFAGMGQKLQIGQYSLRKSMTMTEIADKLTTGDGNPIVRNITLIPGETIEEFVSKLVRDGVLENGDLFLSKCRAGTDFKDYYYIDDILHQNDADKRKYILEGYLAPDTYEIYMNATEDDIIRKLLSQTEAVFTPEIQERADELGLTMDQVLTLASMIEKEAGSNDFKKVSSVFHNRLKAGMKLESDVTIHYATGIRKMALDENDLKESSPYNTYIISGLPIGPICNPSPSAIQAAIYPDETYIAENYLYFCAKNPESGDLYFSKTLAEHEQAVSIYAPLWKQYDQSRGIE